MNSSLAPAHLPYRPDIDGLRTVAILPVLLFHAFPQKLPGGFTGVDVFFVISGYLITGILLKNMVAGTFTFGDFYARRIKRLFPALLLVLTCTLVLGWFVLFPDEFKKLGALTLSGIAFLANFRLLKEVGYFDLSAEQKPLLHLWSLGIEEQFYILWPFILYAFYRRPKIAGVCLVFLWVSSFTWNITWVGVKQIHAFYLPWTRFWELGTGALIAFYGHHRPYALRAWHRHGTVLGFVGVSLIALSLVLVSKTKAFPGFWALLPTLGTALVIISGPHAWFNQHALGSKPFVAIGRISYPLYLWHWPILSYLALVEVTSVRARLWALSITFILAIATYLLVEKRSQRGKNSLAWGLCALMLPIALVAQAAKKGYLRPAVLYQTHTCAVAQAVDDWAYPGKNMTRSTFQGHTLYTQGTAPQKVLFVGDSNMEQYYPRMDRLLQENHPETHSILFLTGGGCAPLPGARDDEHPRCHGLAETALELAKDPSITSVVLGAQWAGYMNQSIYYFMEGEKRLSIAPDSPGQKRAYHAFESLIAQLKDLGKEVYVVLNIPILTENCPRRMLKRHLDGHWEVRVSPTERFQWDKIDNGVSNRLKALSQKHGVHVIDPLPYLCDDRTCFACTPAGDPLYKDSGHLRASYVRTHISFLDHIVRP